MESNKQKLKVSDYVFEIDGKDITKVEVEYEFLKNLPAISIDIKGVDNNNNEAWFCFELGMDLKQLNNYIDKPVEITEFVSDCEAFIKKPNMDHSRELDFYFPTNTVEDIYHNLTSIWVVKKETNIFIFKVCVPSDGLFAFFEVDFNNEKGK